MGLDAVHSLITTHQNKERRSVVDQTTRNEIVSSIWGNADHVLRGRKAGGGHPPLRALAKSSADILAIEKTAKALLDSLPVRGTRA